MRRKATDLDRDRVYWYADQGESIRQVALAVFGSKRYRDRVHRLLVSRRREEAFAAAMRADGDPFGALAELEFPSLLPSSGAPSSVREDDASDSAA